VGRRGRIAAIVVGLACIGAGVAGAATTRDNWTNAVKSVPGFRVPRMAITANDTAVSPGFIFVTPRTQYPGRTGPTIFDSQGHVVWFHRQSVHLSAQDLRPQIYNGKPVLTWSLSPPLLHEGDVITRQTTPHNTYNVIADQSYHIIKHVRALGHGVITDGHEFVITKRNTALVLGGRRLPANLSRYGGPAHGEIIDNLVQEIDLKSNRVLFSWSAARHISMSDSMAKYPKTGDWDPFHLNSISEDSNGNLLVSARHTSTVYEISRHSGRIIWRLGGKHSDFRGDGTGFYYQHDAARQADGTITLFDNHTTADDSSHGQFSVGKRIRLDMKKLTARVVRIYHHPSGGPGVATSQGNVEVLPNGNVFIGWGISPWVSEYAPDGRLLFGAHFPSVWHHSYRAFKGDWVGKPTDNPALTARTSKGNVSAYVSWNGATEVASWQLLGGDSADSLSPIGTAPKTDFDTRLLFAGTPAYVQGQALDANGAVIGRSAVIQPATG
jgi:hypothetical protein